MATEDGKQFEPLFGPGLTGLANLGNSCYLSSVAQVLFSIPSFAERYHHGLADHVRICKDAVAECYYCQMAKLADGLLSGRYSNPVPSEDGSARGQAGIAPSMFKNVVGKGHEEFSTMRQQDAAEFLQHVLSIVEKKEKARGNDPSKTFKFDIQQRLQCVACERVRYTSSAYSSLSLPVLAIVDQVSDDGKKTYKPASLQTCLNNFFTAEVREYQCPADNAAGHASVSQGFKTYPTVLALAMSRFVLGANWVLEKLSTLFDVDVDISAPETLDLDGFRAFPKLPGEQDLPQGQISNKDNATAELAFNQTDLDNLIAMGFPEIRCKRALIKTGHSGADAAMNWLFEHMEDPDIDAPLEAAADSNLASEGDVAQLMDMGFARAQAKKALKETSNNMERAVDWLFSHPDPVSDEPEAQSTATQDVYDSNPAVYELFAFISHRGTSAHCGHYVAYIKKQEGWVLFNDNKVVAVPDISPNIGEAYVYFYRRK